MSDLVLHVFAAKVETEDNIQDADEVAEKVWMPVDDVNGFLRIIKPWMGFQYWRFCLHLNIMITIKNLNRIPVAYEGPGQPSVRNR